MAESSSEGWMSGTVILGIFLVLLLIIIIVVAFNFNSQVKFLTNAQEVKHEEVKKALVDTVTMTKNEYQRLVAQINELKNNQDRMVKTYKKRHQLSLDRFDEFEDRFCNIDELIESYGSGEPVESKTPPARETRTNTKKGRGIKPTVNNLRSRQKAAPKRRATFAMPSDEDDEDDDMSDSEIAAAEIRQQNKTLLDI